MKCGHVNYHMMFPHWTWQWGKSVSPKCRSKNLVATGKHGHVPCDVVNYHTEACSRTRLGVEWPFRHSVVFGPSARFLAVCPTWGGVRGLFGRMVMLFWGIVRVAFLFPRPGSGSPFFGKLSDFTTNNHGESSRDIFWPNVLVFFGQLSAHARGWPFRH